MIDETIDRDILDIIDEHLQAANSNTKERLSRIQAILDFLSFQKRLTELSDAEKKDYYHTLEGYPITIGQRATLVACKSEKQKNIISECGPDRSISVDASGRIICVGDTSQKPTL